MSSGASVTSTSRTTSEPPLTGGISATSCSGRTRSSALAYSRSSATMHCPGCSPIAASTSARARVIGQVELDVVGPGALAQAGEEAHRDLHGPEPRPGVSRVVRTPRELGPSCRRPTRIAKHHGRLLPSCAPNLLLATAAATLAFAAPAAAAPFTDVGPFTGPAGQITLAGGTSTAPAQIDWGLAGGVPNPTLSGRLFMDNVPGVQARVRVVNYDNAINLNLLGTQNGALRHGCRRPGRLRGELAPPSAARRTRSIADSSPTAWSSAPRACTMGVAAC